MNWVDILIIFVVLIGEIGCIYVSGVVRKASENRADILQNRIKDYESEKGRNLATKEDIEEITKMVEEVKAVVSLSNQKRHDQLAEQERILLGILFDATKIAQSQNKMILYLYDISSRTRYDNLVESVNDTLAHFYHLNNLAVISIRLDDIEDRIGNLSVATTYLASQINVAATNAASLVDQFNNEYDHAMKLDNSDPNKAYWIEAGSQTKSLIEGMRGKSIKGRDELDKEIDLYCSWLKQLYGKEFFVLKTK